MTFKLMEVDSKGIKKEVQAINNKKSAEELKIIEEEIIKYDYFANEIDNKERTNIQKIKRILRKNKH